jgi:hypothetical protein
MTSAATQKRRTKPAHCYMGKESDFQRTAIQLVRMIAGQRGIPKEAVMHIPNGSKRPLHYGSFVKAQGMVAGYPDIMLFEPEAVEAMSTRHGWGNRRRGLGIELKVWPNAISPEQEAVHDMLRAAGWRVVVCYGLDTVEAEVRRYLHL